MYLSVLGAWIPYHFMTSTLKQPRVHIAFQFIITQINSRCKIKCFIIVDNFAHTYKTA